MESYYDEMPYEGAEFDDDELELSDDGYEALYDDDGGYPTP